MSFCTYYKNVDIHEVKVNNKILFNIIDDLYDYSTSFNSLEEAKQWIDREKIQ